MWNWGKKNSKHLIASRIHWTAQQYVNQLGVSLYILKILCNKTKKKEQDKYKINNVPECIQGSQVAATAATTVNEDERKKHILLLILSVFFSKKKKILRRLCFWFIERHIIEY